MTDQISISVPRDDKEALVAGATMLLTLAGKVPVMELEDAAPPPAPFAGSVETPADLVNTTATGPESAGAATGASPGDAPPPSAGVELDANGLPWDARIHTGTKSLNKDGTWRYKTGVDREALVPQVEAELRALMAIPVSTPPEAPQEETPPPLPPAGTQTASQSEATPPPGAAEVMNNTAPTPPPAAPGTWPDFLKAVSAKIQQQQITMDRVTAIVQEQGIDSLQLLGSRPDLIPLVWAQIEQACNNG